MHATNFTSGAYYKIRDTAQRLITRQRLPLAALCCGAALVWADQSSNAAALCFVICLALTLLSGFRYSLVVLLLSVVIAGAHHRRLRAEAAIFAQVNERKVIQISAKILSAPEPSQRGWRAEARVITSSFPAIAQRQLILYGRGQPPQIGQQVECSGKMEPIPGPRNEGEFDRAEWMRRSGYVADFFTSDLTILPLAPDPLLQRTEAARLAFRHAITQGLEPEEDAAKVIKAMVLGEQPPYTDPLLQPFRNSGTLHLFSVSGQHVNLVAVLLWLLLRFLRVPRKASIALLIPAIFCYAWMTGASAPAIRAAWMAAVFLGAFFFQRKPHLMNALSIVMIAALLANGHLLFLAGVQLSYGVVAAIAVGSSLTSRKIHAMTLHDSYLPRDLYHKWQIRTDHWWRWLWQSISISTAACIGSAPLTMKHFGMVTPISIIANIALTPLVALLLGLALASAALAPISTKASCFCNRINAYVAQSCIHVSEKFATIPGSHLALSWHRPSQDCVHIFDIPRGGGAVLLQSHDADVLLDCADQRNFEKIVMPCLRHFGAQPDALWLSHPESGHIGGGVMAMDQFPLRQIISPVTRARSPSFRRIIEQAQVRQVPVYLAQPGISLKRNHESIFWEILDRPDLGDYHNTSDFRVAIYLLHFHGFRILFLQDAGPAALDDLTKMYPKLQCDVVICGRHRLYAPVDVGWFTQWNARVVIASHADFPAEESLDPAWVERVRQRGITLFHQGETGMVSLFYEDSGQLRIKGFLQQQQILIEPTLAIPE